MREIRVAAVLCLALAASVPARAGVAKASGTVPSPGRWSAGSLDLATPVDAHPRRYPSPDSSAEAVVENDSLAVHVGDRYAGRVPFAVPGEILWSEDSAAFAVTSSDGGEDGTWRVTLHALSGDGVRTVDPTGGVVQAFLPLQQCREPELPDVGAVAWVDGSRKVLVVARVPSRPGCSNGGFVQGYVVALPSGSVERTLSESELLEQYRAKLGREIRH
jgi:hypothetical protein